MRKLIAIVVVLTTSVTSCTWFTSESQVVKDALIDCAKQDLGQTVAEAAASLLSTVINILAVGGTNWHADLDALEAKYGPEAIACAAHVAEELFRPAPSPAKTPTSTTMNAHDRALAEIAGRRFR